MLTDWIVAQNMKILFFHQLMKNPPVISFKIFPQPGHGHLSQWTVTFLTPSTCCTYVLSWSRPRFSLTATLHHQNIIHTRAETCGELWKCHEIIFSVRDSFMINSAAIGTSLSM